MSRIGKKPIHIPENVTVEVKDGFVVAKGPKGEVKRVLNPLIFVEIKDGNVLVDIKNKDDRKEWALWGTFGAHIRNMVAGVAKGYQKKLEINGVGYKVAMQGKDLRLEIGYSHPVIYKVRDNIKVSVEKNVITIDGADKESVGQTAAEIRELKKPEPYKGKGIKYSDEVLRHKAGKAAGKTA
jgi:large subunit ribosomal protein L6